MASKQPQRNVLKTGLVAAACAGCLLVLTTQLYRQIGALAEPDAVNDAAINVSAVPAATDTQAGPLAIDELFILADPALSASMQQRVLKHWNPQLIAPLLELNHIARIDPRVMQAFFDRMGASLQLDGQTPYPQARPQIQRALWNAPYDPMPGYAGFKAALYRVIDPRFESYFDDHTDQARIRLDEVQWGGVRRDGIPPLKNPKHVAASDPQAGYLADGDVVFGVSVNGESRAYPKRILAWHEMVKDFVGGESINGVYCTLCGSMIVYHTESGGKHYELGTSGFLYRSNKLMYDHKTESMWSTITGEPVIGPLVGQGIKLKPLTVVTTTWGAWKTKHPDTDVITLDTGHARDYGEGVAYRDYFATDALMFHVPQNDARLKNKASVLALRFGGPGARPTAIASDFLKKHPVYTNTYNGQDYVVLTDSSGAHRIYERRGLAFTQQPSDTAVTDAAGTTWSIREASLLAPDGRTLKRLPSHNAFWFGWHAAHPDTVLIQQ